MVWNMFFHAVGNFIIPTDELIFFRGVGQPPTRYVHRTSTSINVLYVIDYPGSNINVYKCFIWYLISKCIYKEHLHLITSIVHIYIYIYYRPSTSNNIYTYLCLVGNFRDLLGRRISTDFHIFQSGRSTTNQIYIYIYVYIYINHH